MTLKHVSKIDDLFVSKRNASWNTQYLSPVRLAKIQNFANTTILLARL